MAIKVKDAVKIALQRNSFIATQEIEVKTKGYIVVLKGEVDSHELVFEAIATAESVSPLLDVRSRLTVRQPATETSPPAVAEAAAV